MALNTLHSNEQDFLKRQIAGRYCWNTKSSFAVNQSPRSFESLLDDILNNLKKMELPVSLEKSDDDADALLVFKPLSDGTTYSCSWRALKDFFFIDKTKNDAGFLNTIYAYLSNKPGSRVEFLERNPDLKVEVNGETLRQLFESVWQKFLSEVDDQQIWGPDHLPQHIISKIQTPFSDECTDVGALSMFLGNQRNESQELIWVDLLNTLTYYLSDRKQNWAEYQAQVSLKENNNTAPPTEEQDIKAYEKHVSEKKGDRPARILTFAFIYLLALMLTSFAIIELGLPIWISLIPLTFLIWHLGRFYSLRSVMKTTIAKQLATNQKIDSFWLWWFGETPIFVNQHKRKARVLVVHDDSFQVQQALRELRTKFNVVQIIEFICERSNQSRFNEFLKSSPVEGLYLLFTQRTYEWHFDNIDEWSKNHPDIPVVYIDYIGIDHMIGYGNPPFKEAGSGLWYLLSQATRRTALFREQAQSYYAYSMLAIKTIAAGALFLLILGGIAEIRILKMQSSNRLLGVDKVKLLSSFLNSEKTNLLTKWKETSPDSTLFDVNLSIFLENPQKQLSQIGRSDFENRTVAFSLTGDTSFITSAYDRLINGDIERMYLIRDSSDTHMFSVKKDKKAYEEEGNFYPDQVVDRNDYIKGLIGIRIGEKKAILLMEVLFSKRQAEKMFIEKGDASFKLLTDISERILKTTNLEGFPVVKEIYNR